MVMSALSMAKAEEIDLRLITFLGFFVIAFDPGDHLGTLLHLNELQFGGSPNGFDLNKNARRSIRIT